MGRSCYVCLSSHRPEYEEMRFKQGKSIKEICTYAHSNYGENIGYYSFQRHFLEQQRGLETIKNSNKLRQKIIEEDIKKDVEISQRLRRNLEICAQKTEEYAARENLSSQEERTLLEFIGKTGLIIEELLKWSKQLNLQPKTEDIFQRILYCMHDFPSDLISKFEERWSNYEPDR